MTHDDALKQQCEAWLLERIKLGELPFEANVDILLRFARSIESETWLKAGKEATRYSQVFDGQIEGSKGDDCIRFNALYWHFLDFGKWCEEQALNDLHKEKTND